MKRVSQLGAQRLGSFLQPNLQPPALPEPKKMQDCSSLFFSFTCTFLVISSVVFLFCGFPLLCVTL